MLSDRALLVSFNAGLWSARRLDRKVTNYVGQRHHVDPKRAGRYNKLLIDVTAKSYQGVQSAVNRAREYHLANTLPWGIEGQRVLPAQHYLEYGRKLRKLIDDVETAAEAFYADYPRLKDNAKRELVGLYREADYPTPTELRRKFYCSFEFVPFPDKRDFRLNLDAGEIEAMRERLDESTRETIVKMQEDLWRRLYKPVAHMAASLSHEKRKFHDTLVSNIATVADLLPKLNVTNDPELDRLALEVKRSLTGTPAQLLREDPVLRQETAAKAKAISDKIAAFFDPTEVT